MAAGRRADRVTASMTAMGLNTSQPIISTGSTAPSRAMLSRCSSGWSVNTVTERPMFLAALRKPWVTALVGTWERIYRYDSRYILLFVTQAKMS
jgi:hypothetical protein